MEAGFWFTPTLGRTTTKLAIRTDGYDLSQPDLSRIRRIINPDLEQHERHQLHGFGGMDGGSGYFRLAADQRYYHNRQLYTHMHGVRRLRQCQRHGYGNIKPDQRRMRQC